MSVEEYIAQVQTNLNNYHLGLTLALQEIEDYEDYESKMFLRAYTEAKRKDNKEDMSLWADYILKKTGRGYLADILPKLSNFVPR